MGGSVFILVAHNNTSLRLISCREMSWPVDSISSSSPGTRKIAPGSPPAATQYGGEGGIRTHETAHHGLLDFEFCGGPFGHFQLLTGSVQYYRLMLFPNPNIFPLIMIISM